MKIKHLVIIVFLLLGIFLLNSCDLLFGIDVEGTWILEFDWGCSGSPYTTDWYIYDDGTFSDADSNTGTWVLSGNDFTATYDSGTTYWGTVNDAGTEMSNGTMESYSSSTGCWSATKV